METGLTIKGIPGFTEDQIASYNFIKALTPLPMQKWCLLPSVNTLSSTFPSDNKFYYNRVIDLMVYEDKSPNDYQLQ